MFYKRSSQARSGYKFASRFLLFVIFAGLSFDTGYIALTKTDLIKFITAKKESVNVSNVLAAISIPPTSPLPTPTPVSQGLKQAVDSALAGSKGSYGIYIKNLKTGETYADNEHTSYESASLYKLWIMAVAFQEIQNGTLTEDQELQEDIPTLNQKFDIDPDDAELTDGTIDETVIQALTQMITISHNYSALLLTEQEKLSTVKKFLTDNDFNESTVGTNGDSPTTTASDIAHFLEKLYNGQLANPEYTKEMIDLMKDQQLNSKLPQGLPDGTVIAHKTGEIDYYSHDAGIVYTPKGNYIIVVMSQTDNPPAAVGRIAQISQNVYNYFMNE